MHIKEQKLLEERSYEVNTGQAKCAVHYRCHGYNQQPAFCNGWKCEIILVCIYTHLPLLVFAVLLTCVRCQCC